MIHHVLIMTVDSQIKKLTSLGFLKYPDQKQANCCYSLHPVKHHALEGFISPHVTAVNLWSQSQISVLVNIGQQNKLFGKFPSQSSKNFEFRVKI